MRSKSATALLCSAALVLQGCATASKDITPTYVSPLQYQGYDCEQIAGEVARIQARVVQLGGRLDQAASNDAGIMAVGLLLFWPVLFALGGTKQQEAEYSRLKGEYDALEQQAVLKKCRMAVPQSQPVSGQAAAETAPLPGAPQVVPAGIQPVAAQTAPAAIAAPASYPAPSSSYSGAVMPAASETKLPTPVPDVRPIQVGSPLKAESKYMFAAEKFAKAGGCTTPIAVMNIRTSSSETFTVGCTGGDSVMVRCEDGICRELK